MTQPILPDGVNVVGVAAGVAMLLCWFGAVTSGIILVRTDAELLKEPMNIWREPEARARFLRFLFFCAAATTCVIVAMVFGGWPTGVE